MGKKKGLEFMEFRSTCGNTTVVLRINKLEASRNLENYLLLVLFINDLAKFALANHHFHSHFFGALELECPMHDSIISSLSPLLEIP